MPPANRYIPPEKWKLMEALFDRLMDADDPEAVLRLEPNREIAQAVRRLWENDQGAAGRGPLDQTITLAGQPSGPADPCFLPGQLLSGRFRVESLLGAGGMGEVYLAHDGRLHEQVALKTIRRDLAADPLVRRRFLAEVQIARRVTHPHVCRINELFDEGETPFFTMQYLEGVRLSVLAAASGAA